MQRPGHPARKATNGHFMNAISEGRSMRTRIATLLGLWALTGLAGVSSADQTVVGDVISGLTATGQQPISNNQTFDNTTAATVLVPTTAAVSSGQPGGNYATASVTGSMGTLHSYASATYFADSTTNYAEAQTTVEAAEYATVTSSTLPAGAAVTLEYVLRIDGSHSVISNADGYEMGATAIMQGTDSSGAGSSVYLRYDASTTSSDLFIGTLSTAVGDRVNIGSRMDLAAYVAGNSIYQTSFADYSNTLHAYVNAFTAGATITPDSGYNYASLPGDANFDGIVNGQDIADVASHWLQSGLGIEGDANFDGIVNGQDIALIASHWLQAGGGGTGAAVPEPATLVTVALGGLVLLACRRRHTQCS
jgi:hypothetical protein